MSDKIIEIDYKIGDKFTNSYNKIVTVIDVDRFTLVLSSSSKYPPYTMFRHKADAMFHMGDYKHHISIDDQKVLKDKFDSDYRFGTVDLLLTSLAKRFHKEWDTQKTIQLIDEVIKPIVEYDKD